MTAARAPVRATFIAAIAALCSCPPPPATPSDAGSDPGPADGGPSDAGAAEGEGEGEGEGDGEGEGGCEGICCVPIPEPLADLCNEAGEPIYENCYLAQSYQVCGPGDCVNSAAEQELVDMVRSVAAARGYPPSLAFADVRVTGVSYRAAFIITIDWMRFRWQVYALTADVANRGEQAIADEMPLWIPSSLPPAEDVWAAARTCDAGAVPYFCDNSSNVDVYYDVGVCGGGTLYLWDFDVPGSGMSDIECVIMDEPCCAPVNP